MRVQVSRRRLFLALGILGLATLAIFWGRGKSIPQATAQAPGQFGGNQNPASFAQPTGLDNAKRVVAYIYDTVPLTRAEFGDYLIDRQGAERLDNFINRRIIEIACREKGVDVTAAEVEAEFASMLVGLNNLTPAKFESTMLKPYHKTLYEWKEDAIRPRLLLTKLTRDRVQVNEEELQMAFEAHYGEKVDCRIIMWPKQEEQVALKVYSKIRDSEEEFERAARQQASPTLAAKGGQVEPFGRHSTGNDALEKAAFSLRPGELSQVVGTPEGPVVIKCIKHIPPEKNKSPAEPEIRNKLSKEVFEKKLQIEIQRTFAELRAKANPKKFLSQSITEEELKRQVSEELQPDKKTGFSPRGN